MRLEHRKCYGIDSDGVALEDIQIRSIQKMWYGTFLFCVPVVFASCSEKLT